jgi:hypothetical protein
MKYSIQKMNSHGKKKYGENSYSTCVTKLEELYYTIFEHCNYDVEI